MSQLTVVLYMFVDIILCWEDLTNGSQESLEIQTSSTAFITLPTSSKILTVW